MNGDDHLRRSSSQGLPSSSVGKDKSETDLVPKRLRPVPGSQEETPDRLAKRTKIMSDEILVVRPMAPVLTEEEFKLKERIANSDAPADIQAPGESRPPVYDAVDVLLKHFGQEEIASKRLQEFSGVFEKEEHKEKARKNHRDEAKNLPSTYMRILFCGSPKPNRQRSLRVPTHLLADGALEILKDHLQGRDARAIKDRQILLELCDAVDPNNASVEPTTEETERNIAM